MFHYLFEIRVFLLKVSARGYGDLYTQSYGINIALFKTYGIHIVREQ